MLEKLSQYTLTVELINRNARIAVILNETTLSRKMIRKTYRQLVGHSASSGRLMESCQGLTRNTKRFKEATLFSSIFRVVETKNKPGNIHNVIQAFDIYKKSSPSDLLDFTTAWVIARDLRGKKIKVSKCPQCQSSVLLVSISEKSKDRCFVCKKVLETTF